jgi:hypothetical protein
VSKQKNKTDKVAGNVLFQKRLAISVFIVLLIGISSFLAWIQFHRNLLTSNAVATVEPSAFKQPETLNKLLALSPAELEHCDIARMNLLCAEALPGAESLNVEECLATLDQWAQHIKTETDRNHHHFKEAPATYSNSEAFYKMHQMPCPPRSALSGKQAQDGEGSFTLPAQFAFGYDGDHLSYVVNQ